MLTVVGREMAGVADPVRFSSHGQGMLTSKYQSGVAKHTTLETRYHE